MSSAACCRLYVTLLLPLFSVAFLLSTSLLQSVEAAESNFKFAINGDAYHCDGNINILCLGDAHVYNGENNNNFSGILSLAHTDTFEIDHGSAGVAYYKEPVRLLDPNTQRTASFNTSFQFFEVPLSNYSIGDGMAFVISADNSTVGFTGASFGIFNRAGMTSFKCMVVEFDSYYNHLGEISNDRNNNHVGLDIQNYTSVAMEDASKVGVYFYNETPVYAWIEYSSQVQTLEVRISNQNSRPSNAILNYTFNLFEAVEEYMWVGFSASNGLAFSSYYVGNWSFESYGIPVKGFHEARRRNKWGSSLGISAIAVGISAFLVTLVSISAFLFIRKKSLQACDAYRRWNMENGYGGLCDGKFNLAQGGYRFQYEDLSVATRGFADDEKLGEGGFGCVYRGELPESKFPVAVKKISRDSQQGEKEFRAEVSVISQLRHRNLIRLLGWCIDDGKYYIVYDFMPNGSLDKVLLRSHQESSTVLSWAQRLKVIRGTATAVEYLHHGWNQQVIHRDIKASNVMLDEEWNAKLGDFGLARLANHQKTPSTTLVAGTPGYIAPEAVSSRRFTEKTDVFAFGALALEVACGRKALALDAEPEDIVLVDWVWRHRSEGNLLSVVDKRLHEYDVDQMVTLLLLGLICSHPDPCARPQMRVVVQVLCGEAPVPSVPLAKPSPIYERPAHLYDVLSMDGSLASEGLSISMD